MQRPYKACPKCGCVERNGGYGLAAGGMGAYEHCSGCGILLHLTQETEGFSPEDKADTLAKVGARMKSVWGEGWTPDSELEPQEPVIPVMNALDNAGWRGVADAQWENLEKAIPLLHHVTAPPLIAHSTRTKIVAACTREDGTIDVARLIDLTAKVAKDPWKHEIEEMCVVAHMPFREDDPFKTIADLIGWHEAVALDPSVSKEARKLKHDAFEEGADAMEKACLDIVANHGFPDRLIDVLKEMAGTHDQPKEHLGPWEYGDGTSMEADAKQALAWLESFGHPEVTNPHKDETRDFDDSLPF